jgi:hypothetical protein
MLAKSSFQIFSENLHNTTVSKALVNLVNVYFKGRVPGETEENPNNIRAFVVQNFIQSDLDIFERKNP